MEKGKITDPGEIQTLLENLIKQEDARSVELKAQMKELIDQQKSSIGISNQGAIQFGEHVVLYIGRSKFPKTVSSNVQFDNFSAIVKISLGTRDNNIGYKDEQDRSVWVRTNQDIHNIFAHYFSEKLSFLRIVSIPLEQLAPLQKFDFRKEFLAKNETVATFRVETAGAEGPLCLLSIPSKYNKNDGYSYLKSIFGEFTSLLYVDEADDTIALDSNESWEYFIETGTALSKMGQYQLLIIQFSN